MTLERGVRAAIVAHARKARPLECCGLLVGRGSRVLTAVPARNLATSKRVRYRLDDRLHLDLRRILRATAPPLAILGVYHSHPNGPDAPSETDITEAAYPDWVQVIVSLAGGRARVRAFRIRQGRARIVTLRG
jgi:proteasome lid subunit RPN8/RPN11